MAQRYTRVGESSAEQWREDFGITEATLERVRELGAIQEPRVSDWIATFYGWLEKRPEFEEFFSDPGTLRRVKGVQSEYWSAFWRAEVDEEYISSRVAIGAVHARIGLSLTSYLAAMSFGGRLWTGELYDGSLEPARFLECIDAVQQLINLDTLVVVETYTRITRELIAAQGQTLLEMSTPVTTVWDGILMLPVVGIVDSKRAQDIMNSTLSRVAETQARSFILDISGVAVVDTAVANHFIKITKAMRLMGCECTISGLSAPIAQTMVELGIDVGRVKTTATLKDALSTAFEQLGLELSVAE